MAKSGRLRSVKISEANETRVEVRQRELDSEPRLLVEFGVLKLREQTAAHELQHGLRGRAQWQKKRYLAGRENHRAGLRLRPSLLTTEQRTKATVRQTDRGLGDRSYRCLARKDSRLQAELAEGLRSQGWELCRARYGGHGLSRPSVGAERLSSICRSLGREELAQLVERHLCPSSKSFSNGCRGAFVAPALEVEDLKPGETTELCKVLLRYVGASSESPNVLRNVVHGEAA